VRHPLLLFCEPFSSAATLWLHFPFLSHLKKCRIDATMWESSKRRSVQRLTVCLYYICVSVILLDTSGSYITFAFAADCRLVGWLGNFCFFFLWGGDESCAQQTKKTLSRRVCHLLFTTLVTSEEMGKAEERERENAAQRDIKESSEKWCSGTKQKA
jgi:hypothetical protein